MADNILKPLSTENIENFISTKKVTPDKEILTKKWKVKLYQLNNSGTWDDKGIGYVYIEKIKEQSILNKIHLIMVKEEEPNDKIFSIDIKEKGVKFRNQKQTIMTWKSLDSNGEDNSALSFQDKEGFKEIWKCLESNNSVIKNNDNKMFDPQAIKIENLSGILKDFSDTNEKKLMNFIEEQKSSDFQYIKKMGELLSIEESKLELMHSVSSFSTSETYSNFYSKNYNKLNEENNEELSVKKNNPQYPALENIYKISQFFKNLILSHDKDIIKILMNDNCYLITFAALEYDSESNKCVSHRKYFKEYVQFKNILKIEEPDILNKINTIIRLMYLKDTVLGRSIDELTTRSINEIIQLNQDEIIQYFLNGDKINTLLKLLDDKDQLKVKEATSMLVELINISKNIYHTHQCFLEELCNNGLLMHLSKLFRNLQDDNFIKLCNKEKLELHKFNLISILFEILISIPKALKEHLTTNKELLKNISLLLLYNDNFGLKFEILQIIYYLLEYENQNFKSNLNVLDSFSEEFTIFIDYLKKPIKDNKKVEMQTTKQIIIEIFMFFFELVHNIDKKFWIEVHNLPKVVLFLLKENNKIVRLFTVKLVKVLLNECEMLFAKNFVSQELCDELVEIFNGNKKAENIIFSSLMSLFNILSNNKEIFTLIYDKISSFFEKEENKSYFNIILKRYKGEELPERHFKLPNDENLLEDVDRANQFIDFQLNINNEINFDETPNIINEGSFLNKKRESMIFSNDFGEDLHSCIFNRKAKISSNKNKEEEEENEINLDEEEYGNIELDKLDNYQI